MNTIFEQQMHIHIFGTVPVLFGIGLQIVFALLLGGVVGYDREVKMKAAGLKTNIMICIGATLYTTMSMMNLSEQTLGGPIDPNRIAAQIVSGIGFLGAGAIIQSRGSVTGLTTAATMWVVAAIGYTIGIGHLLVATLFSLTVLVVLRLINPINKMIEKKSEYRFFHVEILTYGSCRATVKNFTSIEDLEVLDEKDELVSKDNNLRVLNLIVNGHSRALERLTSELTQSIKVKEVNYYEINDPDGYLDRPIGLKLSS